MKIFDVTADVNEDNLLTLRINGYEAAKEISLADSEYILSKLKKACRIQKDMMEKKVGEKDKS